MPTARVTVFPGAQVPFGFAQLGPDMEGAAPHGYRTGGPVLGFSQTKASGTGGGMWGNLRLLPYTGEARAEPATAPCADETGEAGFYAGTLTASGVRAELTAERMTGHARFTYPASRAAQLQLDVTSAVDFGTAQSWQQRPQKSRPEQWAMTGRRAWSSSREAGTAVTARCTSARGSTRPSRRRRRGWTAA
ncbi:hypothetical protein [Streptomyces sp. CB03238]|uniref:hypothetical protein n=1 Tax=Streptomyces sp. CB03238 TaxID=1907777 RepID=UPI00117BEBF4|nr:hypothetical protein [Streptomyces sp. CB03238]